ncbi:MAG: hypothetical protein V4685_13405 [Bacteroidota bacterium]
MKKQVLLLLSLFLSCFVLAQRYSGPKPITRQEYLNEEYCSALFKTSDGTILDLENDPAARAYGNILYWLQGRVAGLNIYTSSTGTAIPYIRNQRATVYLDEIPVSSSFINTIPSVDIAMIKVIKAPFAGTMPYGSGGVIAVYTVRGEEED